MKRETFKNIFLVLVVILVILPFLTTFSEQLTGLMQKTPIYRLIQVYIVPHEVRIVALILGFLGISADYFRDMIVINDQRLMVTWNCLGWQSMLFLVVTLATGLQGNYKSVSKIEAVLIGILGTFWINILRITFIVILGGYFPSVFVIVVHDYFATLVTALWLFGFWWFSYSFILEEKRAV